VVFLFFKYFLVERGDYLVWDKWQEGLKIMEKHNMSFDLHLFPHQMKDAVSCFKKFPNMTVILDHLGHLNLRAGEEHLKTWREGKLRDVVIFYCLFVFRDESSL